MGVKIYGELDPQTASGIAVRAENVAIDANDKTLSQGLSELSSAISTAASSGDTVVLNMRAIDPVAVTIGGKFYRNFEYAANLTMSDLQSLGYGSFGPEALGTCFVQNYTSSPNFEVWRLDGFETTQNSDGTMTCYFTPMFSGNTSRLKPRAKVIHPMHKVYGEAIVYFESGLVEGNRLTFVFDTYMSTCFNSKMDSDNRMVLIDDFSTTNWTEFIHALSPDGLPVPVSGMCDSQKTLGVLLGAVFSKVDPRVTSTILDISPKRIRLVEAWVTDGFTSMIKEFPADSITRVESAKATMVTMIPVAGTLNRMRPIA